MSLSSKVKLGSGALATIRVEVDADMVFCSDDDFAFIVSVWQSLREYVKSGEMEVGE